METFVFTKDEKVMIWVRRRVTVEADNLDEATKVVQKRYCDDGDGRVIDYGIGEVLWDTEELIASQSALDGDDVDDAPIVYYV